MAGYQLNFSMSNNAAFAYECGEKPISKWTKSEILALCGDKAEQLKKLTVSELREHLLYKSAWHHTSCKYNKTNFYAFDEDNLEELTADKISEIISNRVPKEKKIHEEEQAVKAEIKYTIWTGNYRRYRKPQQITETVTIKKSDKMVMTSNGKKRVSCLDSIKFIEE